jgi:hypothetical protein
MFIIIYIDNLLITNNTNKGINKVIYKINKDI